VNAVFEKPFALSIGPQGCGEKILRDYFKSRGDVALPNVGEIFFFDRHFQRGPDFYEGHFDLLDAHNMAMEISTTAFDNPLAAQRVYDLLGSDVKLFCPLRDPVSRSYAVYRDYVKYGIVKGGIEEACEQAPQILFSSSYAEHLKAWQAQFENIHFVSYEQFQEAPDRALQALCTFLDLPFKPYKPRRDLIEFLPVSLKKYLPFQKMDMPGLSPDSDSKAWLRSRLQRDVQVFRELFSE